MPIRERLKKVFKSSSPNSSLSHSPSKNSGKDSSGLERWPSNVYKPGEPMPRPKYRAPVKKEHKDKLEAFSFSSAWRRRSHISEYSPMGSRMPSRRNSLLSRKSFGGRASRRNSLGGKSTQGSIGAKSSAGMRDQDEKPEKGRHAAKATRLSAEIENEGDDDITNVGISRVNSREKPYSHPLSRQLSAETRPTSSRTNDTQSTQTQTLNAVAHDHHPFTEEDLALAMKRSHLTVPTPS